MTNFKRNSKVYLVMGGSYNPTLGLVHRFTLENLTDGLVDQVGDIDSAVTVNPEQITTGVSSPTGKGLETTTTTAGVRILTKAEADAWEDENDEWSLSIWFKSETTSGGGDQNRIVSRDLSEAFGVRMNQNSVNNPLTLFGEPGNENLGNTTPNQWNNLVLTFNGTSIEGFVNGVSQGTENYNRSNASAGLAICQNIELNAPTTNADAMQANNGFIGHVSDLRLWNRELTQAEITALYSNTDSGTRYELDVLPDLSFGQTFNEKSTSVKTLHSQDFFEASTIVKANPASFNFTMPLLQQNDNKVAFSRLLDCASFDLYIQSDESTFHLDNCVFTNGSFVIERSTELKLALSGQAEKLSRVGDGSYTLPGSASPRAASRRFLRPLENTITFNSVDDISSEVFNVSAELQNEISWTKYETVHSGIDVSSRTNAMYPSGFTIGKKSFAGSIGRYLEDGSQTRFLNFDSDFALRIEIGETISGTFYGLDFNMNSCSFTSRMTPEVVFTEHFDWRMTSNNTLTTLINYNTL
jgi:hypothetical protein